MWSMTVLFLVGFAMFDEVNKVAWLLEFFEVLCINEVPKLILNANDKLYDVK